MSTSLTVRLVYGFVDPPAGPLFHLEPGHYGGCTVDPLEYDGDTATVVYATASAKTLLSDRDGLRIFKAVVEMRSLPIDPTPYVKALDDAFPGVSSAYGWIVLSDNG